MRRLRALAVISVLWAVIFAPFALVTWARLRLQHHSVPLEFVLWTALAQAILGAVSGAIFGLVLILAERRRTVDKLRLGRLLAWGATGGLIAQVVEFVAILIRVPAGWNVRVSHELLFTIVSYGLVEGVVAAGVTFAIARRGPPSIAAPGPDELIAG